MSLNCEQVQRGSNPIIDILGAHDSFAFSKKAVVSATEIATELIITNIGTFPTWFWKLPDARIDDQQQNAQ